MIDPVLETVRSWSDQGTVFALATVVGVRGSTYRGLAARQVMSEEGASVGTVSGGCLDADLQVVATRVMQTGVAERVEFDLTADDEAVWGWGIGCNGATELLVEPAASALDLARLIARGPNGTVCVVHPVPDPSGRQLVTADSPAVERVSVVAQEAIAAGRHRVEDIEGVHHLFEVVGSPPRVVVFGAGHDAVPVVNQAATLGYQTFVVDDRRQFLTSERFPGAHELVHAAPGDLARVIRPDARTSVVLMSHNYLRDLEALTSLLGTDVAYIGALGPGERLQRMLDDLAAADIDVSAADLDKLHGPAGLDLGAEGPTEIAWSVLAEILSVARGRKGAPLRERKGPVSLRPSGLPSVLDQEDT